MNEEGLADARAKRAAAAEQKTVRLVWDVSLRLTTIWGLGVSALIVAGWLTSRADIDSLRNQINALESRISKINAPVQNNEQNVTVKQAEGIFEREMARLGGSHGVRRPGGDDSEHATSFDR